MKPLDPRTLLNKTVEEAIALCQAAGRECLVGGKDGVEIPLPADSRPGRVTVQTVQGRVVVAEIEGGGHAWMGVPLPDQVVSEMASEPMRPLDPQTLLGKTVAEASALCAAANRPCRIYCEDGVSYPITADVRHGRVNLAVEKGRVTDVEIEGENGVSACASV
jgi:hypothetical protein